MSRFAIRSATALAGFLIAVSIYACGSSATRTESTTTNPTEGHRTARIPGTFSQGMRHGHAGAKSEQDESQTERSSGSGPGSQANRPHRSPARHHTKGCPNGISRSVCEQIATLHAQAGRAPRAKSGKCPPTMSRHLCRAATEIYEASPSERQPAPEPDQCPPTFTREQCEELARALAK